jgi:hypothetical protein
MLNPPAASDHRIIEAAGLQHVRIVLSGRIGDPDRNDQLSQTGQPDRNDKTDRITDRQDRTDPIGLNGQTSRQLKTKANKVRIKINREITTTGARTGNDAKRKKIKAEVEINRQPQLRVALKGKFARGKGQGAKTGTIHTGGQKHFFDKHLI